MKINKYEEAIKDLNEVIRIEPNNKKAFLKRGECYEKINNFINSYKDYEKAILVCTQLNVKK
jgi:tetratricopeptide (TPR) repeat protein